MLSALAPPDANAPPTSTATMYCHGGTPRAARNAPPSAVKSSSDMTRGLVSAK